MRIKLIMRIPATATLLIVAQIVISGCGAARSMTDGTEDSVVLRYVGPESGTLKYEVTNDFTQEMDVMGKEVSIEMDETGVYSFVPQTEVDDPYRFDVTIDTMDIQVRIPDGLLTPDVSQVVGKHFTMARSPHGKEYGFAGAEDIKLEVAPGEEQSPVTNIRALFPDLPEAAVRIGDQWSSVDTLEEHSSSGFLRIVMSSIHELAAFDEHLGMKCAVIESRVEGSFESSRTQHGMEFVSDGIINGTDTWYFAYDEGLFVGSQGRGVGEFITRTEGARAIRIPSTREYAMAVKLVR
jgi:hypothetical protein